MSCGCNNPTTPPKEYLMVESTPSEASTCEPSTAKDGTASCPNQDPTYDYILSSFLVPIHGSFVSIEVCNGKIYSIGQWLQFVASGVTLQITSIVGKIITLTNQCSNGSEIEENPSPGTAIVANSVFVVVGEPNCTSAEERAQEILEALATAEQICMPDMIESSETAEVHPTGLVTADPADAGFSKCIKRIYGVLFKAGVPFFTKLVALNNGLNSRKMVVNKTTGQVNQQLNFSEYPGVLPGHVYAVAASTTTEDLVGPTFFPCFFRQVLEENSGSSPGAWPNLVGNELIKDYILNLPGYITTKRIHSSYYAMVRITFGLATEAAAGVTGTVRLNADIAGKAYTNDNNGNDIFAYNTISMPVLINAADNKLTLRITSTGATKYYFRLELDGAYI